MTAVSPQNQCFMVSHLNEDDFKTGGLRNYSSYRDLGVAAATNGLATAHVIRMIAPFSDNFSQRHHHDVQFQLIYVLKGWFISECLRATAFRPWWKAHAGYNHPIFDTPS
ncbi:hypothetical protein [Achromobacter kerstersii]